MGLRAPDKPTPGPATQREDSCWWLVVARRGTPNHWGEMLSMKTINNSIIGAMLLRVRGERRAGGGSSSEPCGLDANLADVKTHGLHRILGGGARGGTAARRIKYFIPPSRHGTTTAHCP